MRVAVMLAAFVLGLGVAGTAGGGADTSTAIVDRTVSCPLVTTQGFRLLGISGSQGFVGSSRASAYVSDQLAAGDSEGSLLAVGEQWIRLNRVCVAAKRIALTRKALPGPPDRWQSNYDCELRPKRALMRVRAAVVRATPWKRSGVHLILEHAVAKAEISVQTPAGKPIAYIIVAGNTLRLWVSPGCARD